MSKKKNHCNMTIDFADLSIERPIGSNSNNKILEMLKIEINKSNFNITSLPIECNFWIKEKSYIKQEEIIYDIYPSPFSPMYNGKGKISICKTLSDLKKEKFKNSILLLKDEITKKPIMPKDFPFYYPDEDRKLHEELVRVKPKCILTITGKDPMSGLDPFPFFEDGNLQIPSAFFSSKLELEKIDYSKEVEILINSNVEQRKSEQLIFQKFGKKKETIVICAHMDSKYSTPGALDNASGLYTIMKIAKDITSIDLDENIIIVPFNGEEYYEVSGQLKFLEYIERKNIKIKLVINIDSAGFLGSQNALSFYNMNEIKVEQILKKVKKYDIVKGTEWYAGDHAIFAFRGIQCIVATSNNLFETAINITHTQNDKPSNIDFNLLKMLAKSIVTIIKAL